MFEKDDTVFVVSSAGFVSALNSDFGQPLKPNFSRRLLVDLKEAPSDWSGKVEARVAALEFDK